jgi:hypothetical protein
MVAADCPKPMANPPFDGDNWTCDAGLCRWLGCLGDRECAFFNGVCRDGFVSEPGVSTCTEGCQDVSECAEMLASVDADNWSCTDGGCKYEGCLSNAECVTDFGDGAQCIDRGMGYPTCAQPCSRSADCVSMGATPVQDADNWLCNDGLCVYGGCVSDDECTMAEGVPAVCAVP